MKNALLCLALAGLAACGENAYDRHSTTDDVPAHDSATGLQTGSGTESQSVAAPNAANTTRTPVPLDSVVVDTTAPEGR